MNRQEATARMEALLARVVSRRGAPRTPHAPRSPGVDTTSRGPDPVETLVGLAPIPLRTATPAPVVKAPVAKEPVVEATPEELHAPLGGDQGQGPEIDLSERTMDVDLVSFDEALLAMAEPEAAAAPYVESTVVEEPPTLKFEPEPVVPLRPPVALRMPTPAPTPAAPVEVHEPEIFEPSELPAEAAAVRVVPMAPLSPRSLRDLVRCSLALTVRPTAKA